MKALLIAHSVTWGITQSSTLIFSIGVRVVFLISGFGLCSITVLNTPVQKNACCQLKCLKKNKKKQQPCFMDWAENADVTLLPASKLWHDSCMVQRQVCTNHYGNGAMLAGWQGWKIIFSGDMWHVWFVRGKLSSVLSNVNGRQIILKSSYFPTLEHKKTEHRVAHSHTQPRPQKKSICTN